MSGFFPYQLVLASTSSGGQGGFVGAYISAALLAGENDNFNPGGAPAWPGTLAKPYGRLDLTGTGIVPAPNVTGLVAGLDGQVMIIRNAGALDVTLNNLNAGSVAANQFSIGPGDVDLTPGNSVLAIYYAGAVNKWVVTL